MQSSCGHLYHIEGENIQEGKGERLTDTAVLQSLLPASMEPEPVIGVAAHIRFNHLGKHTRILDNILLQIPCATYRNFLTKDEPMMSLAGTNEKTADDRTSSA